MRGTSGCGSRWGVACLLIAGSLGNASVQATAAQAGDFFAGKQITLLIGGAPGGGYDLQARLVARHLGKHIPGQPVVVPQNMPGGAGLAATNHIYNVAPRDGTAIALVQRSMLLVKAWNPTGVRFDLGKLNWIGSVNSELAVTLAWHSAPHQTAKDLLERELIVGGVTGGDPETTPRLLNALIGTKFKIINGYRGTNDIILAMERGELHGLADWSWSSLKASRPAWLREKKIKLLLQTGMQKHRELEHLPLALDFVKNDADRKVMELYLTQKTIARPIIAPPGLPSDRLATLRKAFAALAKDEAFLADGQKAKLDVEPIPGEEIDRVISVITSSSPDTIAGLQKAISPER